MKESENEELGWRRDQDVLASGKKARVASKRCETSETERARMKKSFPRFVVRIIYTGGKLCFLESENP